MSRLHSDMESMRMALYVLSGRKRNKQPLNVITDNALAAWERVDRVLIDHISAMTRRHIRHEQSRKAKRPLF